MKKLVSSGRLFAFGVLVVTLIALCVVTLYKLQIIEGAAYYEESQNNQASNQTVTAARGNILDRYGRVLVSNRECYNLKISDTRLFSDEVEDPNAVILEMINMVEAAGETYIDDLPITKEPPFEYTDMTALQRTLLTAYLDSKGLDEDTTAVELMSYFRTRYDIANSYNAEEMRKIASVRYALNVRYSINTNPYVFVEDASIDLISDLMGVVGNVVEVETSYVREYNTQYAAHILGYVQAMSEEDMEKYRPQDENSGYDYDTKVGRDGVEYTFEDWLHGTNGTARVTRTSSGTITSTVYTEDPVPGNHVYLTIDIQLQEAVERILETGIYELQLKRDEDNAKYTMEGKLDEVREDIQGGAIVVVDVKTGEPLAIASYPTFDLSSIIEDYSDLLEAENDPLFNRALNGAYEPGSTFKPCTAIAGLTENIINTETQIECTGLFTKYADQGYAPACWIYTQTDGQLTHGYDNVTEAIKDSCNVFFYTVADNLGIRKLMEYAKNFGKGSANLIFMGGPGLGKTYLSACIARVVAERGCSVAYESAAAALSAFETQRFSRDGEESAAAASRVREYLGCDLMILDDLGTEMVTSFSVSALYQLINTRLNSAKPTIISTNCTMDELERKYGPQIMSRLEGEYLLLTFHGRDIRLQRKERGI